MNTQFQRVAFAAAIANINSPHVQFWGEIHNTDIEPFSKLLTKALSFVRGELKSEANLLRFHDEFCTWREAQQEDDSLAYRILELCAAALHSTCESLFDKECDDTELLQGSVDSIWAEMEELGSETQDLRLYWQDIQGELNEIIGDNSQIPFPKAYFQLLKETDVSLFGLADD